MDNQTLLLIFLIFSIFSYCVSDERLKIAIIGSGIGGSNLARLLLKEESYEIDMYEKSDRIGGRIDSQAYEDKVLDYGGLVFSDEQKLITGLAKELNLELEKLGDDNSSNQIGIMGNDTLYFEMGKSNFYNLLKLGWKYGTSPFYFKSRLDDFKTKFDIIYKLLEDKTTFRNIEELMKILELSNLVNITVSQLAKDLHLDESYTTDAIQNVLYSIYTQKDMSAFSGLLILSQLSGEYYQIKGGNLQLVKTILDKLKLLPRFNLILNEKVTHISKHGTGKYSLHLGKSNMSKEYDLVILATPMSNSGISFSGSIEYLNRYANVPIGISKYVSYIKGELNYDYFKTKSPPKILMGMEKLMTAKIYAIFNFGDFHKIHSERKLDYKKVDGLNIFGKGFKIVKDYFWDFSCGKFDHILNFSDIPGYVIDTRLFYLSAHESITSSFEMSLISSENIANLIFDMKPNNHDKLKQDF